MKDGGVVDLTEVTILRLKGELISLYTSLGEEAFRHLAVKIIAQWVLAELLHGAGCLLTAEGCVSVKQRCQRSTSRH
jgi:hypothetical protein